MISALNQPLSLQSIQSDVQKPKVLLVNDDAASLTALESLLTGPAREREYELIKASTGQEALRQVLRHDFAVILLDVDMPGMDGFETADAIHSHPRSALVPIIFITAYYADELHKLEGYGKGAVDYLFTPIIPQVLQTKVSVFVELARKNGELKARTAELEKLNQDLRVQRLKDLERANRDLEEEVSERRQAEQRAHELSIRDPLTGLVNRRALIQQLEHAVASSDRHRSEFALLYLDLDRFKEINDTLGHEVGDELLRQVAGRLLSSVRASDVVARLGGDEFVVLLEGKGAHQNAARVAKKIDQAHSKPFDIGNERINTSASVGIALYPQDGPTASLLMKRADTAMYHAKQMRRGSIAFFSAELTRQEGERARLSAELHQALQHGQLELYYLPKADVATGAVAGLEALLYWNHPRLGAIPAAPMLAESNDRALLDRVNDWAVGAACGQAAGWQEEAAMAPLPLSLNLAMVSLQAGTAALVARHLGECKLPRNRFELEISERQVADAPAQAVLRQIASSGARIALDAFGTTPTSLSMLRDLPLSILKMDRSFASSIGEDPAGADLVAAIIHLARALRLTVVATGVGKASQLDVLKAHGCDQYQGELFSPPLHAQAVPAFVKQHMIDIPRTEDIVNE